MAADEPSDGRRTGAAVVRGPRRLAGEIRERLPWIEEQLAAGYSREQVVIALQEVGVAIKDNTLKVTLWRARKSRAARINQTEPIAVTQELPGDAQSLPPLRAPQAPTGTLGPTREPSPTPIPGVGVAPPPPEAATTRLTMREAMDPKKRAEFAAQFFETPPLVLKPKPKSER